MIKHLFYMAFMTIVLFSCKEQTSQSSESQNLSTNQTQTEEVSNEPKIKVDFVKTFEGQINNKYDIVMKLISNNGQIKGNYFYKSKGDALAIAGEIEESGNVILNEFDKNGNQTGLFNGILINENKIEGKWNKPDGSNKLDFYVLASNSNYETLLNEIAKKNKLDISGTYESPYNDGGVSSGTVVINNVKSNSFDFEISTAHQSGCNGIAEGTATLDENGDGKWSGSDCESIIFKFDDNSLTVEETNCELHGMRCGFMGEYNK